MEGNYAMQHIRQDIITYKSRKKGNDSIKNMSQDINHKKVTNEILVTTNTFDTFA
jgi:CRISPR/Cas system CMR-associated protein Cmr5 small subunit